MYELIQVTDKSYYIQCPAKIGLVRLEGDEVCLIDSGSDKDAGRKVRQILDANKWQLRAIYNTHSNADTSAGITTSRNRLAATSMPQGWSAPSHGTPSWNRPSCMAATRSRSYATSS